MISPTACGAPFSEPRGTLVEPSWALVEAYLRSAPDPHEPIWAETPKLSAVGEKGGKKHIWRFSKLLDVDSLAATIWQPFRDVTFMDPVLENGRTWCSRTVDSQSKDATLGQSGYPDTHSPFVLLGGGPPLKSATKERCRVLSTGGTQKGG